MTKTAAGPKKKVCKVCAALPYLEAGAARKPGVEYRPRVDRPLSLDKDGNPVPGPRCFTHKHARKNELRDKNHAVRLDKIYGITSEFYWALYEAQGGKCYICQRATGKTKKLAVDHDHSCCNGSVSCGECVRGLLCGPCNQGVIGHLYNSIEALQRAIDYLNDPPARKLLAISA